MGVLSSTSLSSVCVVVIVFVLTADVVAARKKGEASCEVSAADLERSPFVAKCSRGWISSLKVVGHKGSQCQGLTPDLFVQMNSCFWKNRCTLRYSTKGTNYMLKLYKGNMSQCVTKQPDRFDISYECTSKKVKQLHIVRQPKEQVEEKKEGGGGGGGGRGGEEAGVKDKEGVLVSHADHPWLYRRHFSSALREHLALLAPKKKLKALQYTIRTLSLMAGDNVTVRWTSGQSDVWESAVFDPGHALKGNNTFVIPKATRVVFSLKAAVHTNGGEGFVICFRWMKKSKKRLSDTCKRLLVPQRCRRKERGKPKKEKKRSKGEKP